MKSILRPISSLSRISSRLWRPLVCLLLVASMLSTTGCFGRFYLTKSIYRENTNASDNEFFQSLIFWPLLIGYAGTLILDTLVLNPLEFWFDIAPSTNETANSPTDRPGAVIGSKEWAMVIAPGVIVRWPSHPPILDDDPESSDAGESALATGLAEVDVEVQ